MSWCGLALHMTGEGNMMLLDVFLCTVYSEVPKQRVELWSLRTSMARS